MNPLKERVARAALEAATAAIADELGEEFLVELIQIDPLVRQVRVTPRNWNRSGRYFMVKVSEAI